MNAVQCNYRDTVRVLNSLNKSVQLKVMPGTITDVRRAVKSDGQGLGINSFAPESGYEGELSGDESNRCARTSIGFL